MEKNSDSTYCYFFTIELGYDNNVVHIQDQHHPNNTILWCWAPITELL